MYRCLLEGRSHSAPFEVVAPQVRLQSERGGMFIRKILQRRPHFLLPMLSFLPLGLQVVEEALLATVQAHAATVRPTPRETTVKPAQAGVASSSARRLISNDKPTTNTTSLHVAEIH